MLDSFNDQSAMKDIIEQNEQNKRLSLGLPPSVQKVQKHLDTDPI